MSSLPNPLTGTSASNPLGWPGQTGTNAPSTPGGPSLFGTPTAPVMNPPSPGSGGLGGGPYGNPGGFGNPTGGKEVARNTILDNITRGQLQNQLIPWFTQMMGGAAGPAADFFKQLMNLGSPYYQEKQRASFEQGTQQSQNAAAGANQRLAASGYGYAPSGLQAGVLGQEATGQAQNLSQMFLQNLFQNENMQALGAQGLSQMAQLFNPSQLLGGTSAGASPEISSNFFQNFSSVMSGLFGQGGAAGGAQTGANIAGGP